MVTMSLRDAVQEHTLFTKTRLYSLYSDFRKLKEANPEGYEGNLIAWKSLIEEFFQKGLLNHAFVLETDGLLEQLILPAYGKPMAVDVVLEELIKSGDLIPLKQFEAESIYATRWVRPVLSWAVNKFIMDTSYKLADKKKNLKSDRLISKKTLETYAFKLCQRITLDGIKAGGTSKTVFTLSQFRKYLDTLDITLSGAKVQITDLDFEILITFLQRDSRKIQREEEVIKFSDKEITDQDKGITQLKSTLELSHLKCTELNDKINLLEIKIKESLQKKNKELAKILLRSKKIAQESLNKQLHAINQLESVLYKIDEASTNIQIVDALEVGSSVLKSLNAQIGGVDRVEDVMNKLEDEKAKTDEITENIHSFGSSIDEDEIDEEYEELLRQETAKKASAREKKEEEEDVQEISERLSELKVAPSDINENKESAKREGLHN